MKVIVITGAAGGVGSMLARGLAKGGNHIVCLGRKAGALEKLVAEIKSETSEFGGDASFEVVDMTDAVRCKEVAEKIVAEFGRIDAWINNAGANYHEAIGPIWELETQAVYDEFSANFFTAYTGSVVAVNAMKTQDSGYIINLGGGGVQHPKPFGTAYGAAKTAVVKFTETLNIEFEACGLKLKAFAFNPGFIRNERTEKLVDSDVCQKYMPSLEQTLKYGKMSDIQDSIDLLNVLISGKVDALAGRYFVADGNEFKEAAENVEKTAITESGFLRVL